jgi:transposase-like protein
MLTPDGEPPRRSCRHCGSDLVQRWGTARGRARHRCRACSRTFTEPHHVNSPQERRRRAFLVTMLTPAPVRSDARTLGVHPRTILRWRYRVLRALAGIPVVKIGGEVLLTKLPMLITGTRGRVNTLCIMIAQSRTGVRRVVRISPNPGTREAEWLLRTHMCDGATVVHNGRRFSSVAMAAVRCGLNYIVESDAEPKDEWLEMRQAARRHGRRINRWLRRFRGVDSDTMEMYLAWHEALDSVRDACDREAAWLALCEMALADQHKKRQ